MSDHTDYLEQPKLEAEIEAVERECKDLRWALSSRRVYGQEMTVAQERLARLKAEAEEQES